MPFWAFLHFYTISSDNAEDLESCQCPSGLSFISTVPKTTMANKKLQCVNALLGFPSFLLFRKQQWQTKNYSVSMPFWAFLHFYNDEKDKRSCRMVCVNALLGFPSFLRDTKIPYIFWFLCVNALLGFPSFLQYKIFITIVVAILCQCPSGLSFISTASFWNPQKQSIFQAFFAGIYLKILKIKFFRLFFVLFTICSYFNTNHSCT